MRIALRFGLGLLGLLAVLALAIWGIVRPPAPLALPERGALLDDVTLIEPGAGRRSGARVVIEGDRIARIEPASGDGTSPFAGMFVLPGLNDLHVHFPPPSLPGQTELFAFLYLYHGVTAVRDAGDPDGASTEPARRGVAEGRFPGPRVLACGPFIDGEPPRWKNSIVVKSPADARDAVRRVAEAGFDCVKAYDELAGEPLAALREEAHARDLPVIGHVPWRVPFEEARLDDAQHMIGVPPPLSDHLRFPWALRAWNELDDTRLDFIARVSLRNRIAHTPTLVTTERLAAQSDYEAVRREGDALLLPRFYRDVVWSPDSPISAAGQLSPDDFAMVREAHRARLHAVKRLFEAGVELHTGTDSLIAFVVPGAALHRELRLFVEAGLTPEQALAASTRDSARFLRVPGLGELAPGAPAELAIFREDPTRDLAALDTLAGVVRDGRLFSRERLDAQLARYREHYGSVLYDALVTPLVRRVLASTRRD
jgi:imidazolonepropionase-like amidohydrolase